MSPEGKCQWCAGPIEPAGHWTRRDAGIDSLSICRRCERRTRVSRETAEIAEHVRFAEAVGVRVFWVDGLKEGALGLAKSRVLLLDRGLPDRQIRRAVDAALVRLTGTAA